MTLIPRIILALLLLARLVWHGLAHAIGWNFCHQESRWDNCDQLYRVGYRCAECGKWTEAYSVDFERDMRIFPNGKVQPR